MLIIVKPRLIGLRARFFVALPIPSCMQLEASHVKKNRTSLSVTKKLYLDPPNSFLKFCLSIVKNGFILIGKSEIYLYYQKVILQYLLLYPTIFSKFQLSATLAQYTILCQMEQKILGMSEMNFPTGVIFMALVQLYGSHVSRLYCKIFPARPPKSDKNFF